MLDKAAEAATAHGNSSILQFPPRAAAAESRQVYGSAAEPHLVRAPKQLLSFPSLT
jgi:hypothetical protein